MTYSWCYRLRWGLSLLLMLGLPLAAGAQQPSMSDSLWKSERNPEYFKKALPFLDAIESYIITDPQAMVAALLSKRIYWRDAFPHANMDRDLAQSTAQQNPNVIATSNPGMIIAHITLQHEKPPSDDLRVRQAISEAIRREAVAELGNQSGAVRTGVYPLSLWTMPKAVQEQLIGYDPDMAKHLTHAKELLAPYEREKGKIDWSCLMSDSAWLIG